ncbi:MAG TPA: L-fucose:H+ symporter permease [Chitinophagaceae bacterium]|jgi:FHS family L-fucose permease-like MFS transporter|nr:L-fucose:H+ symporter permease [Chitinophagaceae bacterium]
MSQTKKYLVPFILVTSLFFLWAFLHNINPILIPHLKKACQLTDTQSSFVDIAVYLAYFSIALPAGWFMHKYGYKKGILFGLFLYGAGSLLFIPAADARVYWLFLVALFIIASGATFLETVANPYITKLGDPKTSAQRLNFAQSFNGVGAFLAPIIGGQVILSGIEHSKEELAQMSPETLNAYLNAEAATVKIPYLVIGVIVLILLALFFVTKLPDIKEGETQGSSSGFSFRVFRHAHLSWAVIAQLFYVGAQTCVGSFFIRFSKFTDEIPEKRAAFLWGSIAMVGFMIGRFSGTFLMKYIKPAKLLGIYALINMVLVAVAVMAKGTPAVYAIMAVPFFMSIMFPTIFAMGITGLGEETKIASSFIVMSIVGGAIFPVIMGQISDATNGNIQLAYMVPVVCFAVIAFFAYKFRNLSPENSTTTH